MAAVVCRKLPKGSNDVVLSCNPAMKFSNKRSYWVENTQTLEPVVPYKRSQPYYTLFCLRTHTQVPGQLPLHNLSESNRTMIVPRGQLHDKTSVLGLDRKNSPVRRELLMAHHELQVVDDHMTNIIDVDSMLHCIYYRPGTEKQRFKQSTTSSPRTPSREKSLHPENTGIICSSDFPLFGNCKPV